MIGHRTCHACGKQGHKADMICMPLGDHKRAEDHHTASQMSAEAGHDFRAMGGAYARYNDTEEIWLHPECSLTEWVPGRWKDKQ